MEKDKKSAGTVGWIDLTVPDAKRVKDFYHLVTGWKPESFSMGDYDDYVMNTPGLGEAVAGICNAKGSNASLPAQWLIYINVDNLHESMKKCVDLGGEIIAPVRIMPGQGKYCVIKDPAGAVSALFEQADKG